MNRGSRLLTLGAAAALLTMPSSAVPAPPVSGLASATSTLLSLDLGVTSAAAGVDRATSRLGTLRSATASMDFLTSGVQTIAGGSRSATSKTQSGSDTLGTGRRDIDGLAAATITGATIEADVDDVVRSAATLTMADVSLLGGFAEAASVQTSTTSAVDSTQAVVSRTVRLGSVSLLSVRELLARLGVQASALDCSAVEAAGAKLGLATSEACEKLVTVRSALLAGVSSMEILHAEATEDLATVEGTVAGITLVTQEIVDLAARYGIDLATLLGLVLASDARDTLVAAATNRIDALLGGIGGAAGSTCDSVKKALAAAVGADASLQDSLKPLEASLSNACDALRALVDMLLDASLLGLDGVRVALTATATPGAPFADGSGSIGSITVGSRSVAVAGLTSTAEALSVAVQSVRNETAGALNALGIGAFPLPSVEILKVAEKAGTAADGTWFADVEVTALHLGIPSVPLSMPGGAGVMGPLAASSAGLGVVAKAPVAATPPISVDAAVFSGSARFASAGGIRPIGPLPRTGVPSAPLLLAGVLMLASALVLARGLVTGRS